MSKYCHWYHNIIYALICSKSCIWTLWKRLLRSSQSLNIDGLLSFTDHIDFDNYNVLGSNIELQIKDNREQQLHSVLMTNGTIPIFKLHTLCSRVKIPCITSSPACDVFISQLFRYTRACSSNVCFILRTRKLSSKILSQEYVKERLKSLSRKFYGRYEQPPPPPRILNDILE